MDKTLLVLISLNILITIVSIFIKEYLKEKGKNLATKEDIHKITEQIELVKNEVSFQNSQKVEWLSNNKKYLSEYFELYLNLSENIVNNLIFHNFFTNLNELREFIRNIENDHAELKKRYYLLYLYEYEDKKFTTDLLDITNDLSKIYIQVKIKLVEIEKLSQVIKMYFDETKKVHNEAQKNKLKELENLEKYLVENSNSLNKNRAKCTILLKNKLREKYDK